MTPSRPESENHGKIKDDDLLEVRPSPFSFRRWFSRRHKAEVPTSATGPLFDFDEVRADFTVLLLSR